MSILLEQISIRKQYWWRLNCSSPWWHIWNGSMTIVLRMSMKLSLNTPPETVRIAETGHNLSMITLYLIIRSMFTVFLSRLRMLSRVLERIMKDNAFSALDWCTRSLSQPVRTDWIVRWGGTATVQYKNLTQSRGCWIRWLVYNWFVFTVGTTDVAYQPITSFVLMLIRVTFWTLWNAM